jgi:hypothetical protein
VGEEWNSLPVHVKEARNVPCFKRLNRRTRLSAGSDSKFFMYRMRTLSTLYGAVDFQIVLYFTNLWGKVGVVMSTIPKRKYKRSDIEANYRNETKTFSCVPKKEVERFYLVQKLGNEIITFLCVPEPFK